ncbi:rhodanese-related sulfurtransferase [Pseudorhodoferax sp. LjRoot39]|uniref:oxygen-dependent tRNA uridine(34) hydroxylase TrhO n=1 Tax=Pseudorhodoferax sp. LjRoot39 TaxID=3342328 RepID=UPI003ECF11DB
MPRTASFYCFATLPDCAALVEPLRALCAAQDVRGNILLAPEGINGSIAGQTEAVQTVLAHLRADPRLARLAVRSAACAGVPLHRLKVRCKREIVTLGVPGLDPVGQTGEHVPPAQWNGLLQRPDLVLLDVRNGYEVAVGSFDAAVDPGTAAFTDWPAWVQAQQQPGGLLHGKPPVAMFCTGGIRCEKASSLLLSQGFGAVYQLEGGILNYLEQVPPEHSRWRGECFVFDERVAVGHGLAAGTHSLCRSCRHPLGPDERASALFVDGVQCPHCAARRDDRQRQGYRERQRQVELAAARGQAHIGLPGPT